jgi:hypothetical protein
MWVVGCGHLFDAHCFAIFNFEIKMQSLALFPGLMHT